MNPTSHPGDDALLACSIGDMPPGGRLVVGVHVACCARCRDTVRFLDLLGGVLVGGLDPVPVDSARLDRTLRRTVTLQDERSIRDRPREPAELVAGLRRGGWRPFVPGVDLADVEGRFGPDETVCLLRGAAGSPFPTHGHENIERFVVLEGAFGLDQTVYGPGDYVEADAAVTHTPFIPATGDCLCLLALQGGLVSAGPGQG